MKVIRYVQQNYTEHPDLAPNFQPEIARKVSSPAVGIV